MLIRSFLFDFYFLGIIDFVYGIMEKNILVSVVDICSKTEDLFDVLNDSRHFIIFLTFLTKNINCMIAARFFY